MEQRTRVCHDCLFWPKFKEKCWYFWGYKKFCTMKVTDKAEQEARDRVLK